MRVENVLVQLGYPANEVKVYLATLSLGESTITELAKKTEMPRTTIQSLVEDMHRKGLLNFYPKKDHKYWVAENPEKLLAAELAKESALKGILPELKAMRYSGGLKPTVKIYAGSDEVKHILDDIISTKHHLLAIVAWEEWIELFGADYIEDFIRRRAEHFLKVRLLAPNTPLAQSLKRRDQAELRQTKFLPAGIHIKNTNYIYGNKVAIISLNKHQPYGVILEDEDIADTLTVMFEALWRLSND